ncbi:hypothetical protein N7507_007091 [Penicillium longicatenatum]|nr:hypothetical protein N7507_007091 [Penicillium longicatenatum]
MADLAAWALPRLSQLLPLDEESLKQIVNYSADLAKDACADHLKNLLGDSPAALEFITLFNARRDARSATSSTTNAGTINSDHPRGRNNKEKKPLHSPGPPRRPDNYGNMGGGYIKANKVEDYMSASKPPLSVLSPDLSVPGSSASSPNQSPIPISSNHPPSASGPVLSDMLPNVRSKTSTSTRRTGNARSSKGSESLTANSISDLTAAIAALEVSTNPSLSTERRKCACSASIHPLFDPAPNCLNCGKIICALEGLQPCSFCGTSLLSTEEVQSMIRELRNERGQEKMRAHNEGVHPDGGPRPVSGSGSLASRKLDAARAHRDKLLNFQAHNAQRTKVVDEAADFETPSTATTLWMSPAQRALALKKQQRIQRELEEKARPEWEKKKTVMSLDIKGGKVRRVYQSAAVESTPENNEPELLDLDVEESLESSGRHAFSRNPLLAAGGLMRPIWHAPDGKIAEKSERPEPKKTWRRVQDDNDDNESWILDGGLHGYDT